jgi:phosphoglycolate phosphatase
MLLPYGVFFMAGFLQIRNSATGKVFLRMGRALRLVVFDCDGTLVDSQFSIVKAMNEAFSAQGLAHLGPDAIKGVVGLSLDEAITRLLPDAPTEERRNVALSYKDAFAAMRRQGDLHEPLYPGVKTSLEAFEKDGWLLGVATGKSFRGLKATLKGHGLAESFITLQTADRAAGKPHPEMLQRAMAETGVDAEQTVMVGDTTFDMEMACNAGVGAIGVSWGYHGVDDLREAGAWAVVRNFDALIGAASELSQ